MYQSQVTDQTGIEHNSEHRNDNIIGVSGSNSSKMQHCW